MLASLRKAYCDAGLWRPQDLGGVIQAELNEIGGAVPVVCEQCRRPYVPVHARQLFCCSACRIQHNNEQRATAEAAARALPALPSPASRWLPSHAWPICPRLAITA